MVKYFLVFCAAYFFFLLTTFSIIRPGFNATGEYTASQTYPICAGCGWPIYSAYFAELHMVQQWVRVPDRQDLYFLVVRKVPRFFHAGCAEIIFRQKNDFLNDPI